MILRPYQQDAIDAIYSYFGEHAGNPLVIIPTAGGKSLVMAKFVEGVITQWPDQRIISITHVSELIEQNYLEFLGICAFANAGIYSAGLGSRNTKAQVLFCGIQSVWDKAYDLQRCDILLVDEAHLINPKDGVRYTKFIKDMLVINPNMKIIGFTATPYRLGSGLLHEGDGAIFTDIAYEIGMGELVELGFLSPLVSKRTKTQLDVTGVGTSGGDFKPGALEKAVDIQSVTDSAVAEMIAFGTAEERVSWIAFCAGADHTIHVRDAIRAHGIVAESILGTTPKGERREIVRAYKAREIRALTSMGVLTTGFNAKSVDLIAMLRPTKSAGLYVQIAGRGCRLSPETGKTNCLVLDFAGNVARHGPVDQIRAKKPGVGGGSAPMKDCPECKSITFASALVCRDCGYAWPPPEPKVEPTASTLPIMSTSEPTWREVLDVDYVRHEKAGGTPTLRAEYNVSLGKWEKEWVFFEHVGFARRKACIWWMKRAPGSKVPDTVDEALSRVGELLTPTEIATRPAGKYTEIVDVKLSAAVAAAKAMPWMKAATPKTAADASEAPSFTPWKSGETGFVSPPGNLDDEIPF